MNATDSNAPAIPHDDVTNGEQQVPCAQQVEFDFAAAVTTTRRKKRRSRRPPTHAQAGAGQSGLDAAGCRKSAGDALSEDPAGTAYGDDWIDAACTNILNARDLREAVTLSACYLAELIDLEIEARGYCDEWKQAYSAYSETQLYSFAPEADEELGVPALTWAFAGLIFLTYEGSNNMTDWALYEELCGGEMVPDVPAGESPESGMINLFSGCVYAVHDIVCNGGAEVFSPKHSCAEK